MRRGMTLVELLAWSVLALLVLAMAYGMLSRILKVVRVEGERSHTFLNEAQVLTWLSEDLRYANGAGVIVHQADDLPTFLAIHASTRKDGAQQPEFADQQLFYHWDPQRQILRRCEAPVAGYDPLVPQRPSFSDLEALAATPDLHQRQLADHVTKFKVLGQDPSLPPEALPNPLVLHLELTSPDGTRIFTQERTVSVRTSL